MKADATENRQAAGGEEGRGRGVGFAAAGAAFFFAVLVLVLFALPGFVAAEFSKMDGDSYIEVDNSGSSIDVGWEVAPLAPGLRPGKRLEYAILEPSAWLMQHSERLRDFYLWEYNLAHGRVDMVVI